MLPTLMDVLGIPDNNMTMFGQDMLSSKYDGKVVFRDGDWITPTYTKYNNQYFNTKTGDQVTLKSDKKLQKWQNKCPLMQPKFWVTPMQLLQATYCALILQILILILLTKEL